MAIKKPPFKTKAIKRAAKPAAALPQMLGDKILVQVDTGETVLKSGIKLLASGSNRRHKGKVIAVGPGTRTSTGELIPSECQPGDEISFTPMSGQELTIDDVEYRVLTPRVINCRIIDGRVHPLGDRVVVKREPPKDRSEGGIWIPDKAKVKSYRGEVIAVGRGHHKADGSFTPVQVHCGDRIVFSQHSGDELTVLGEELLLINESSILATY